MSSNSENHQSDCGDVFKKICSVLDEKSFIETNSYIANANVITGYGTIQNKLVYVFAQTGTISKIHAKKIEELYSTAVSLGAPIIGFWNSDGSDISSSLDTIESFGIINSIQAEASGIIPQIAVITGKCMGMASICVALSDFVFMSKDSDLFLESPNCYKDANTNKIIPDSAFHLTKSGLGNFYFNDTNEMSEAIKNLFKFLPSNNMDSTFSENCDDLNRINSELDSLSQDIISNLITDIADNNFSLDVSKDFAPDIKTLFAKVAGQSVGIITYENSICTTGLIKSTSFINFCDAFNIPLITFVNTATFSLEINKDALYIRKIASLVSALANATVPKINVIAGEAVGTKYLYLNSKHIGADAVFAITGSKISTIDKTSAKKVLNQDLSDDPELFAKAGFISDIVNPSELRKHIISSLEMLSSKRVKKFPKKHISK